MSTAGEYFDLLAQEYDRSFRENGLASRERMRAHALYAQTLIPGNARIGDFGCGHGDDTVFLTQFADQVVAVDASAEMLRLTRAKAVDKGLGDRIVTVQSDIRTISGPPFNAGTFDAIVLGFGVVNCFHPVADTLGRIADLLRPAGVLILSTLTPRNPLDLLIHLSHGTFPDRWRRQPQLATYGDRHLLTYARSAKELVTGLPPGLQFLRTVGVGTVLPPAHGDTIMHRAPAPVRRLLEKLDQHLESTSLARRYADMVWLVLQRSDALRVAGAA